MAKTKPVTIRKFFELLKDHWEDKPDDYVISVGDWHPGDFPPLQVFHAYMRLTMGEIRQMLDRNYKPSGENHEST